MSLVRTCSHTACVSVECAQNSLVYGVGRHLAVHTLDHTSIGVEQQQNMTFIMRPFIDEKESVTHTPACRVLSFQGAHFVNVPCALPSAWSVRSSSRRRT
jgi:hypothetical protein